MPATPSHSIGAIRVALADHSPVGRKRLRQALSWMDGMRIVGEAATERGVIRVARRRPAVIVISASLARRDLLRAARTIKGERPAIQIIAVTPDAPKLFLRAARQFGVHLCVPFDLLEWRLPGLVRLAHNDYRETREAAGRLRGLRKSQRPGT